MSIFFRVLSAAYIVGIFLLADSPMVSDVAPFNRYSLLHIPLYGILTILLILSNWSSIFINRGNSTNSTYPSNSINHFIAGMIAFAVAIADEIYQSYIPSRAASITDVLLDVIGIVLCMLLMRKVKYLPFLLNK